MCDRQELTCFICGDVQIIIDNDANTWRYLPVIDKYICTRCWHECFGDKDTNGHIMLDALWKMEAIKAIKRKDPRVWYSEPIE